MGKEYRDCKDDNLYSSTPPLEAMRYILSQAATRTYGKDGKEEERSMAMTNDISRAYFNAPAIRDIY